MRNVRRRFSALLLGLVLAVPAFGQSLQTLSGRAQISMITILSGDAVHSAFGHSALRVYDPATGIDSLYNYGTFDFGDPLFLPKFVYGKLDYFLSVVPYPAALRHYRSRRRPVIEQVLNLSTEQENALFRFLQINARPENKYYRYDFLFDNCSTRIRDALQDALNTSLRFADTPDPNESFRHLLDPYVANRPWVDVGFDLVLGAPTGRTASPREAMFLPCYLMEAFDHAAVERKGQWQPLVARRDTVFWIEGRDFTPPAALPWPAILCWSLLAVGLVDVGWRYQREHEMTMRRWADVADAVLFGVVGLAGALMLFMWFISEHYVTNQNWNLLWAWPTHLGAAWALARGCRGRWLHRYLTATAVLSLMVAAGWLLWPQDLPHAALPLTLLLALRSGGRIVMRVPRNSALSST